MTAAQIAQYATAAGFAGQDLATAVAIAMAESSGKPGAIGDSGNSIGLWQINLPAHPEYSNWDLTDPMANATAAFNIYQVAGFRPWTTFRTLAYQKYLPSSSPAQDTFSASQPSDDVVPIALGVGVGALLLISLLT